MEQESLEAELGRARELSVSTLADAIESIGFECTRCGACCKANEPEDGGGDGNDEREPHTATLFPDEARELQEAAAAAETAETAETADTADTAETAETAQDAIDHDRDVDREYDWRDVARPMPYGLRDGPDGPAGETFEWAIQTDVCGDCTFYREDDSGTGACTVHERRPLVCQTYPFSVALGGTTQPLGEAVDREGLVRAHECEGLGRDIDREAAEELAAALRRRAIRELEEAIALRDRYEPRPDADGVVVHDSEGAKRPDGTLLDD